MVYLRNWTEYESAATALYSKNPDKVRYCVKFRPKEGQLVLKITDDSKCIKFKTHSSIVLNRFENLNHRLLTLMASPTARPSPPTLGSAHDVDLADVSMSVDRQGTPGPGGEHNTISARQSAGGAGGGVGKKKKGKGKK